MSEPDAAIAKITVEVRAFARYSEILGVEQVKLELDEPATVGDAVALLRKKVANGHLLPLNPLVAIDLAQVRADTPLSDGDELALLPPLAGG